jgi:hypothetical protein
VVETSVASTSSSDRTDVQGAKAAHKREINAKDAKKAGSQLKTNAVSICLSNQIL